MIAVIDYGMGNLFSVKKALEHVGASAEITDNPEVLNRAEKIILPGVGAFGDALREIEKLSLADPIRHQLKSGKPFLGICLGLQILFESSEESPGVPGLGILRGKVPRFQTDLKVPHMGWNSLKINRRAPIFRGIDDGAYVYFVHSYYVEPENKQVVSTSTDYDISFTSSVWKKNLFATQFHPEKSQDVGLRILENFVSLSE